MGLSSSYLIFFSSLSLSLSVLSSISYSVSTSGCIWNPLATNSLSRLRAIRSFSSMISPLMILLMNSFSSFIDFLASSYISLKALSIKYIGS